MELSAVSERESVDVSVVVPVRNGGPTLIRQLMALLSQDFAGDYEVLVVNNGSTDGSLELSTVLAKQYPSLRVLDAPYASCRADAVNRGVELARGSNILTTDADDLVCHQWVARMYEALQSSSLVAGATKLQNEPFAADPFGEGRFPHSPPVNGGHWEFAVGCNMGFTRTLFGELSGFDPVMNFAEDVDFSWRAQSAGYTLGFAAEAKLVKSMRSSPTGRFKQHRGYGRSDLALAARYRTSGYGGVRTRAAKQVVWLILNAPWTILSRQRRADWLAVAGRVVGVFSWKGALPG